MFGKALLLIATLVLAGCGAGMAATETAARAGDAQYSIGILQFASACEEFDDWDKPTEPFQIHGNTYYVGTCGIAAILIVGDDGLVLIDTGTEPGSKVIENNIAALGYSITDVKAILTSHEHFDHVGGLARLQALSGAVVYTSVDAAPVLRTGLDNPLDPQAGMHAPMAAVASEIREVGGGETISVAGLAIRGITTPGHTLGAMSWQWESCNGSDCKAIVFADSLSPVSADSYRFSDHPAYLAAFGDSIAKVAALRCDILLTPHPSASDMLVRARGGSLEGGLSCAAYAASKSTALDERLAKEAAAQ